MTNRKLKHYFRQIRYLRSRWLIVLHDSIMIPIAWLLAYWFRYNLGPVPQRFLDEAISLVPLVMATHIVTFLVFGVHRGVWRFISIPDLVRLVKAVVTGTVIVAITIFFVTRLQYVPRSVFVLHGVLLIAFMCGPRLIYRLMKDRHIAHESERKVLVVGAGAAGEQLVRDLLRTTPRLYEPIAFVDDDLEKRGKEIHGIRVLGSCSTIPLLCEKWNIDRVLIAMPTATAREMQRVVDWCEKAGTQFRTLPKLHDIVSDDGFVGGLRKVQIDDLLGREPVSLDWESISQGLQGKRILVTGGGGSIGSELCRQLVKVKPSELIILEQGEFNLYSIRLDLSRDHPDLEVIPLLGDVYDARTVDYLIKTHKPQVVFHAAAYKHVPLLQEQIRETLRNNILGTRAVADAADRHGCEAFVQISTDKAVNPTSMMGASKRIAEIYCQALSVESKTRFVTVRFGNVLGSAGSVIPLFRKQIESGGPVTVTDPEMTRYFMTLAEACQLILQASVIGKGSEIYVLNMGEPIKIAYLARQMIRLSGKRPGGDIEIVYTGLRAGEKLEEELFHGDESLSDTGYEKILLAQSRKVGYETTRLACDELAAACDAFDFSAMEDIVRRLVPEYSPNQDPQLSDTTLAEEAVA